MFVLDFKEGGEPMTDLRVHTWMTEDLGLSGTRLLAFAVVYAKTAEGGVTAIDPYLHAVTGLETRQLKHILHALEAEGLLDAERSDSACTYRVVKGVKITHSRVQKLHGVKITRCKNYTLENAQNAEKQSDSAQGVKITPSAENPQEKAPHTPQKAKDIYINNITPHSIRVAPHEISASAEVSAPRAEKTPAPVAPSPSGGYMRRPTVEEVRAYCEQRGNGISAEHFVDHYTSNGWRVGRNPMKDWKAAVRTWERKASEFRRAEPPPASQQRRGRLERIMDERAKFYEILNGKFDDNK